MPSLPAPVSSPAPVVFARPRIRMLPTGKAREESPRPARSISDLRTYDSSPSPGERIPQLPSPTTLEDAVDFEPSESEDERLATAKDAGLVAEEPGSTQAPPLDYLEHPATRLPGAWTSLS